MIRQGKWREAKKVWNNLNDKGNPIARTAFMQIHELESSDTSVPLTQRQKAKDEATAIRNTLDNVEPELFPNDEFIEPAPDA